MSDGSDVGSTAGYQLQWPVGYGPGEEGWCDNPASQRDAYLDTCPPPTATPTPEQPVPATTIAVPVSKGGSSGDLPVTGGDVLGLLVFAAPAIVVGGYLAIKNRASTWQRNRQG